MLNLMEKMCLTGASNSDLDAETYDLQLQKLEDHSSWIHDSYEDGQKKYLEHIENEVCKRCESFFKDSNVSPPDSKYCYSRVFNRPESMNTFLYTPGDCGLSQCSAKCTTGKMKTNKYNGCKNTAPYFFEKSHNKIRQNLWKNVCKQHTFDKVSAEIHEHTDIETSRTVSRDEPHENDHVIYSEKQPSEQQLLEQLFSDLKSVVKETSPKKQSSATELRCLQNKSGKFSSLAVSSLIKSKAASIKAVTSTDYATSATEQASLGRSNNTAAPLKLKILKQSSGSVSILKSSANIKNQRVLQQLQPSALGNFKQIRNSLLLPKQLESDGDSISPRSESPQSYNGNSFEELGLDQDQVKSKLGVASRDQLWWPSHHLRKAYNNYSEQVTRQRCAREKDNVVLTNDAFPINYVNLDHSYHNTGEKKDSHFEWNQSMTDSSESESEIDVVSDKPDRNWARQQESSLVSNAQLMASVSNDQLMAPVSTAQPTEFVRRSSRIQKSENRKKSREDLSPEDLPAKRTKLKKEHGVKKIYGTKKVNKDTILTKRECHNQNERNRRYGIKNNLSNLQKLIPKFANRSKPPTKQETLDAATKYLSEQERENRDRVRQKEELLKKQSKLIKERDKLKQRCLMLGMPYRNELFFER